MQRLHLIAASVSALLFATVAGNSDLHASDAVQQPAHLVHAAALKPAESRIEGERAIDAALAAAVIGAVSASIGESEMNVALDLVDVRPDSIAQSRVQGEGRMQLGDDAEWFPFQFSALYDNASAIVIQPKVAIGVASASRTVLALDSDLAMGLKQRADAQFLQEFAQQQAKLSISEVRRTLVGKRLMRVEGMGIADFGTEGTVLAKVTGLYDQRTGRWMQTEYALGPDVNRGLAQGIAFAGP